MPVQGLGGKSRLQEPSTGLIRPMFDGVGLPGMGGETLDGPGNDP